MNKLHSELKILNGIFSFNLKKNKVILKFQTFKASNFKENSNNNSKNKYLIFSSKKSINDLKSVEKDNKSNNNLIFKDNELGNITSNLNIYEKNKYEAQNSIRIIKNNIPYENSKLQSTKSKNEMNQHIRENNIILNKDNFK